LNDSSSHELFIVHGQLDGNGRQILKVARRRRVLVAMTIIKKNKQITMKAVEHYSAHKQDIKEHKKMRGKLRDVREKAHPDHAYSQWHGV
jgi:hypothetical protein